jgi:hypothetical protein
MPDPTQNDLLEVPATVVVNDVMDHEVDPRKKAQLTGLGLKDSGWFFQFVLGFFLGIADLFAPIFDILAAGWDGIALVCQRFFTRAQGDDNTVFWALSASIVSEFMGTQVTREQLQSIKMTGGKGGAIEGLGNDLYNDLVNKLTAGGQLSPDQGVEGAKQFLGFLMSLAVRQGNLSAMLEMLPPEAQFAKGFEKYGEAISHNLGLSRLARLVLHPMMQILVGDQFTYALRKQYRPTLHDAKDLAAAYFRGHIPEADMAEQLKIEGWTDQRGKEHIDALRPRILPGEIFHAYDVGALTRADTVKRIGLLGYIPEDAEWLTMVHDTEVAQKAAARIATKLKEEFLRGVITETEWTDTLKLLELSEPDRKALQGETDQLSRLPRHTLTYIEMHKAFLEGVITVTDWDQYLIRTGYRQDDRAILTNMLLLDQAKTKSTGTVHAATKLSWAQLKAGYKTGILSIEEVTAHLTHHGYSADDIAILLKELPTPPASPPAITS